MARISKASVKRAEMARVASLTPEQCEAEKQARVAALVNGMLRSMSASTAKVGRSEAAQSAEDLGMQSEAERIRNGGKY